MSDQHNRQRVSPMKLVPIVAIGLVTVGFSLLAAQQAFRTTDVAPQSSIAPPEDTTAAPEATPALIAQEMGDSSKRSEEASTETTEVEQPTEYLEVVGTVPLEGDSLRDQIVVFFNNDLEPNDDPAFEPLRLDPPVAGTFRTGERFVAFAPSAPTDRWITTVSVHPSVRDVQGNSPRADWQHAFSTDPFKPVRIVPVSESTSTIALSVRYPTAVDAGDLLAYATATGANGDALDVQVQATGDAEEVRLLVHGADNWPATLTLRAGLSDTTGALSQAQDTTYTFPKQRDLRIANVYWASREPSTPAIGIEFNEDVDATELEQALTLQVLGNDNDLPFTLREQGVSKVHVADVQLTSPLPNKSGLRARIEKQLAGIFGGAMKSAAQQDLQMETTPFALTDSWWEQRGRDGLALQLRFTDGVSAQAVKDGLEVLPALDNIRVEQAYGSSVYILGDWDSERVYEVRIAANMERPDGNKTDKVIATRVRSDEIQSYLGFNFPGKYYFPRLAAAALTVESRNLRKADVTLHRMFPSNVAVAINAMNNGEGGSHFVNAWAEKLSTHSIPLAFDPDRITENELILAELLPNEPRGLFGVGITGKNWTNASKLVLMTNIGLLAHWQGEALVLFAHDLYSLDPHDGARVTVYSAKNQVLGQTTTDALGIARLDGFDQSLGRPTVAVVERGDDYTFVELEARGDTIAEVTPSTPNYDAKRYDAFVYADRDLYRPGETAHVRWLVRHNYGDAVEAVPLKFIVTKPNGRVLIERAVTLSDIGSGGLEVQTRRDFPTGTYTARLEVPGSKQPAGSYGFKIEEFVPNRLRTEVTLADPYWVAGETYAMGLKAEHLAGGAAADRRCEGRLVFRSTSVALAGWEGFRFGNDAPFDASPVELGDARTDASGAATFTLPTDIKAPASRPLKALAVGRTFELGGRGVFGSAESTWFPSPTCLGISIARDPAGELAVDVAAVAPSGDPADLTEVSVTLEKRVWHYNVRRFYSHHEPHWSESFEPVETKTVSLLDGRGNATFDVGRYGHYRVRVHSEATTQYSTQSFYSAWNRIEVVDDARPSLIKVTTDHDQYKVGDNATVRIESPFDGQAFIVLQGESMADAARIPVTNGVAEYRFTVNESHFPNMWAGVTVVHAVDDERAQVYPFESFAMAAVRVVHAPKQLQVAFDSIPDVIKPGSALPVSIAVTNHDGQPATGEVTIAVVDEGIHSITGYATPDPYAWVARLRAPDHHRAHYYDKVAYDFSHPSESGDMDALLGKRAASISDNWIKPLALWSGPLELDEEGRANTSFTLPEFSGELRLVAVAASKRAVGATETRTKVRRDHAMRVSVPRFLLPDDKADCRVALMNRTDEPAQATITWETFGGLVTESGRSELVLQPQAEQVANVRLTAGNRASEGRVVWRTTISDSTGNELDAYERTFDIPVRTPAAYQSAHELVRLAPGDGQVIRNADFVNDDRAELSVFVSAQPQLQLADAIDYVVGYPHGCLEQTTSRLMPMYLLRKNSALMKKSLDENETLDMYLMAGIDRLFAMQTRSGGLAGWPGGSRPYEYGSVYALHFLNLVANGREYPLPEASMEALRNYVRRLLEDDTNASYSGSFQRAYATYALTVGGDADAALQVGRFDATSLPGPGRYLLASAIMRSTGDANRARNYLATMPAIEWVERERGRTLNSSIRNTALELLSLTELKGDSNEMLQRANALTAYLRDHRYGNTQETAFIVSALAGYLDLVSGNIDSAAAEIEIAGDTAIIEGLETHAQTHLGADGEFHVRNTGESDIYVSVTKRGIPETVPTQPESNGVSIKRTIYTNAGDVFGGDAYGQAEAYVIALTLDSEYGTENIVLVDKLPAGFEIENPRLAVDAMPGKGLKNTVTPSNMDLRDDRIVLAFDRLKKGKHTYHYIVRAVTPGRYAYPPAQAECMYDASIRGRSSADTIDIEAG